MNNKYFVFYWPIPGTFLTECKSGRVRSRCKNRGIRENFTSNLDENELDSSMEVVHQNVISAAIEQGAMFERFVSSASNTQIPILSLQGEESVISASSEGRMDSIFPPSLILNEL